MRNFEIGSTYFSPKTFTFLRNLKKNNNREWFQAHKPHYETHLRQPFLKLLADLEHPVLDEISAHYRADSRPVGGSLFRIYRDTRFSKEKTPYKPWGGARVYHARSKEMPAPSFYFHLQPGECFVGAGFWHPEPDTQRKIRQFIFENPGGWKAAAHAPKFRKTFEMDNDKLSRPPRGFPAEFEFIDDLKHRNFVAFASIDDDIVLGPKLKSALITQFKQLKPLMDYLCAAVDLEF
jgi:uncharacterized protein (TIGR02453 family)